LMFLMHAGLAVSRSGLWLALHGKKLVTLLYRFMSKLLAVLDWSIAWIDGLMFLMHAGLAVSRSGRWLALYGKNGVTALEVRQLSTIQLFSWALLRIQIHNILPDPDRHLKPMNPDPGPTLKGLLCFTF
jgi:hypothetical protein